MAKTRWGRFEKLRPDELQEILRLSPVAYWPLGLIEHHGWALPVGFDGVKADRFCARLAERTGGVVLPVMWWGSGGGHQDFKWTFYQDRDAGAKILGDTVRKLIDFGFRAIVVFAGHYPWQGVMDDVLTPIHEDHPDILLLWGFECSILRDEIELPGDHASRWETAYGLALLPDLVDMDALHEGRSEQDAWPASGAPPKEQQHPGVDFSANSRRFAQLGEDPSLASAEEAEKLLHELADRLISKVAEHITRPGGRRRTE